MSNRNAARYLVTGGAGFIGSHLVERLLADGEAVRVVDDFSTGKRENLAPYLDRVDLVAGSLADPDVAEAAVDCVEFVLHQAAIPSVPRSVADPIGSHEANVTATVRLLDACRRAGTVRRVVYAASSSAYGNQPAEWKREDMRPDPLSPYAVSKLAGEHYLRAFHEVYGLETVALRYFNVFGPRQDPASLYSAVIPKFITRMMAGDRPIIYGDGLQSRDFTFVSNNVEANLLACRAPGAAGRVFNIACGKAFSLLDLVDQINQVLGTRIEPAFEPARAGDVKHSLADISLARDVLGYRIAVDFEEGLKKTIASFRP